MDDIVKKEKLLFNYRNKLNRLSGDKEYCKMVWDERIEKNLRAQQEYYDGKQEGIEQGIQEGTLETKKEIVLNMYNKKYDIETIAEITNLSLDEVNEIINNK